MGITMTKKQLRRFEANLLNLHEKIGRPISAEELAVKVEERWQQYGILSVQLIRDHLMDMRNQIGTRERREANFRMRQVQRCLKRHPALLTEDVQVLLDENKKMMKLFFN